MRPVGPGRGPELGEAGGDRHEEVDHRGRVDVAPEVGAGGVDHALEEAVHGGGLVTERLAEVAVTLDLDRGDGGEGGQRPVGGVHVGGQVEHGLDLGHQGRLVGHGGLERGEGRLLHVAVGGHEHVALGREVVVDGGLGDAGGGGDVLVDRLVVAESAETAPGGGDDAAPRVDTVGGRGPTLPGRRRGRPRGPVALLGGGRVPGHGPHPRPPGRSPRAAAVRPAIRPKTRQLA